MMKKQLFVFLAVLSGLQGMAQTAVQTADFSVIPLPKEVSVDKAKAATPLKAFGTILYEAGSADMERNALFLSDFIAEKTGLRLPVEVWAKRQPAGTIALKINEKIQGESAYRITVADRRMVLESRTAEGVYRAVQTLRKALPLTVADSIVIPAVTVSDAPRFGYRGMHLDICRHYYDIDFVKKYIDMLALHGMNKFHWHLTDDQGWRAEIKKYPRLTEVGAWRSGTVVGRNIGVYDHVRYGGYFTQEQMREVVRYAADRYITVIPEVDMPGHMEAALAAYPSLGCTGGPYEVEKNWGVFDDILCAGNDSVFAFVCDVLDELMDIFPSEYIHLGGDEAPRTRWKACAKCQQRIADEHLEAVGSHSPEDALQGYFMKRVEQHLKERGRKAIGWDEIAECGVGTETTIMNWRGLEGGVEAAAKGHDVIVVPNATHYFDFYQLPEEEWTKPLLIGGFSPVSTVYAFDPAPDTMPAEARKHIVGLQANLWTEYIYCEEMAEYQVLPRMAALAEAQWTQPAQKDFEGFKVRLQSLVRHYNRLGWKYCKKVL